MGKDHSQTNGFQSPGGNSRKIENYLEKILEGGSRKKQPQVSGIRIRVPFLPARYRKQENKLLFHFMPRHFELETVLVVMHGWNVN
jgi:hypothetical protein